MLSIRWLCSITKWEWKALQLFCTATNTHQYVGDNRESDRHSDMVWGQQQAPVFNVYHSGIMAGFLGTALTVAQW